MQTACLPCCHAVGMGCLLNVERVTIYGLLFALFCFAINPAFRRYNSVRSACERLKPANKHQVGAWGRIKTRRYHSEASFSSCSVLSEDSWLLLLTWFLLLLFLSTLVCCRPTKLIWLFCFINCPIYPPPLVSSRVERTKARRHDWHLLMAIRMVGWALSYLIL